MEERPFRAASVVGNESGLQPLRYAPTLGASRDNCKFTVQRASCMAPLVIHTNLLQKSKSLDRRTADRPFATKSTFFFPAAPEGRVPACEHFAHKIVGTLQGKLLIIQVVWVIEALKRLTSSSAPIFAVQGQYMPVHPDSFGQKWNIQVVIAPVIPKLIKGDLLE